MTQVTHIDRMRGQYNYNRKQVLFLTGMTEAQYAQLMFDTGVEWLCQYTGDDEEMLRMVLSQPVVWQWWKNEWNRRDDEFLPALFRKYEQCKNECNALYRMHHQQTFIRWTPPYNLLLCCYDKVIGKMFDNLKNEPANDL